MVAKMAVSRWYGTCYLMGHDRTFVTLNFVLPFIMESSILVFYGIAKTSFAATGQEKLL